MAESILELTWTELVNAFKDIDGTSHLSDGGGAFRTVLKGVYKQLFFVGQEPPTYPALSVVDLSVESLDPEDSNKQVIQLDAVFAVVAYLNSESSKDATTLQTQFSEDQMALKHDLLRVVYDLSMSHINGQPRFIVDKNIKIVNDPGFGFQNKGTFWFKLPVRILWGDRSLLRNW
jgi:hypothetical protein